MRANELHVLLPTLQGSTVSGLLGMSLKPHTMTLSKPAQHLEELLGKGGKSEGKSKGKVTAK